MSDTPPVPARPADRYGDRPPRRRRVVMAVAVVIAATLGWAVWVALRIAAQPVHWSDAIAVPRDDGQLAITFQVTMRPGGRAVCTVEALSSSFAQVGLLDVTVGPSPQRTITVHAVIPTTEAAASGDVKACTAA